MAIVVAVGEIISTVGVHAEVSAMGRSSGWHAQRMMNVGMTKTALRDFIRACQEGIKRKRVVFIEGASVELKINLLICGA